MADIYSVSNPSVVYKKAREYGIPRDNIKVSTQKNKKYMVLNPETGKWVHFGDMRYSDYTKHNDQERRARYIARASNIPGDWGKNKYSANSLSLALLW